jgi:hypothetical protein
MSDLHRLLRPQSVAEWKAAFEAQAQIQQAPAAKTARAATSSGSERRFSAVPAA